MFYLYIIQSIPRGRFYIGSAKNIEIRLKRHNDGWSRSTKRYRPWQIVYSECYQTKKEALYREREIKRRKSRTFIEELIAGGRPA